MSWITHKEREREMACTVRYNPPLGMILLEQGIQMACPWVPDIPWKESSPDFSYCPHDSSSEGSMAGSLPREGHVQTEGSSNYRKERE